MAVMYSRHSLTRSMSGSGRVEVAARRVQRADRTAPIGQCRAERQVTLCGRRERVLARGRFGKLQQLVKILDRPEWRQVAGRNAIGERAGVHRAETVPAEPMAEPMDCPASAP